MLDFLLLRIILKKRRHAKIGNNTIIGANTVIIGDVCIGNNVTIGAGAIITKDIPDNCVVVGNNIIRKKNSESVKYYRYDREKIIQNKIK